MDKDNIITYAGYAFDRFEEAPLTETDSLVLSWLSYMRVSGMVPHIQDGGGIPLQKLYQREHFDEMFSGIWNGESGKTLLTLLAGSPRFRDLELLAFSDKMDEEEEKQFAAVTFRLAPELYYIAFRGTDATLVGWKEDFNMSFRNPIPSQLAAVEYVRALSTCFAGDFILGGHSKGGNLAVYAAAASPPEVQRRIRAVYSHDGPGFLREFIESEGYGRIVSRIHKSVPQSSIVGMLMDGGAEDIHIIKSSGVSFWQHDPFAWKVRDGRLVQAQRLSADAAFLNKTLSKWLLQLSQEERKRLVEAMFSILSVSGAKTFAQLAADWQTNAPQMKEALDAMDPETRGFMSDMMRELVREGLHSLTELPGPLFGRRQDKRE